MPALKTPFSRSPVYHGAPTELFMKIGRAAGPPFIIVLMFPLLAAGFVILAVMWMQYRFDVGTNWLAAHQARRHHLQAPPKTTLPSAAMVLDGEL